MIVCGCTLISAEENKFIPAKLTFESSVDHQN